MPNKPAIRKVVERLKTALEVNGGVGATVFIDRAFDDAYRTEELPCVNIRTPYVEYQRGANNWLLHDARVVMDIITRSNTVMTIDAKQAEIQADIVTRLSVQQWTVDTLSEILETCEPLVSGAQDDDTNSSDYGQTPFAWRMTWRTPLDDFRTIIGHNGLVP